MSWLAGIATGQYRRLFPSAHPTITFLMIAFLAWSAISITWAEVAGEVQPYVLSFLLLFTLFPIVYSAVDSTRAARMLVLAFVAGASATALYGLVAQPSAASLANSPTAASGLGRLSGTVGDPNELATLLAAGIALSGAIIFDRANSPALRGAAIFAALVMLTGVFLTLSRGGLVALAAVVVAAMLFGGRRYRARIIVVGATAVAAGMLFFFAVASPEARDRITAADGGSGRTDIWKVGWRIVEQEPLQGIGAGNFQESAIHFVVAPGAIRSDEYLVDAPAVAHNSYLQVLSETGIPGLVLWLSIVVGCCACAVSARRSFLERGDQRGELISIALLAAIGGLLAGGFFLSEENSKHLWLLLAIAPALLAVSRQPRAGALT